MSGKPLCSRAFYLRQVLLDIRGLDRNSLTAQGAERRSVSRVGKYDLENERRGLFNILSWFPAPATDSQTPCIH